MLTSANQLQYKTHFIFFQIDITIQKNFSLPAGVTLREYIIYTLYPAGNKARGTKEQNGKTMAKRSLLHNRDVKTVKTLKNVIESL